MVFWIVHHRRILRRCATRKMRRRHPRDEARSRRWPRTKPPPPGKEAPTEPFKRAVAGCMRAIAGAARSRGQLRRRPAAALRPQGAAARAAAQADRAATSPITARLGDSMALRLACHDPSVHRAHAPEGKNARAVFDAVEQARVEALGARRMGGVRAQPRRHARGPLSPRQLSTTSPTAPTRRSRMPSR